MLLDVGNSVAYGSDVLSVLVGVLDIESLLELQDQLNSVERISTEMCGKACFGYNLRLLNTQFVYDDLDNL